MQSMTASHTATTPVMPPCLGPKGSAGEEPRATRSSKPQVGASPRSSLPASGSVGWRGLSPSRHTGKAGTRRRHLSGLAVTPSPRAGAWEQPVGCQLLLSATPSDRQHPLSSGSRHQRLLLCGLSAKTGSVLKHGCPWDVSAPSPA